MKNNCYGVRVRAYFWSEHHCCPLNRVNLAENAVDYLISQQQKPTMSLQKGTIILRLAQLFGLRLIKLDHPHHGGSSGFFFFFLLILISLDLNFLYRMQCCCQNYHLHSTSWYPTQHFFLYHYGTHTHHRQRNLFLSTHAHGILGSCSVFYYLETDGLTEWLTGL